MFRICSILFLLFTAIPQYTSGQLWTKMLGGQGANYISGSTLANDSTLLCIGGTSSYGALNSSFFLARLTDNGNLLWQKTIPTSAAGSISVYDNYEVVQTPDNSIFVYASTNSDVVLFKMDNNGNLLWEKLLRPEGMITCGGMVAVGNDVVVGGATDTLTAGGKDMLVMKVASNATTVWSKRVGGVQNEYGINLCKITGGGFLLCGQTQDASNNGTGYAALINPTGDTLWTRTISSIGISNQGVGLYSCAQLKGDSVVAMVGRSASYFTNLCAVRIRLDGTVSTTYESSFLADVAYDVKAQNDGGFIVAGGYANYGGEATLTKFSSTGIFEWTNRFFGMGGTSYWNYGFASSVTVMPDDGFILTGGAYVCGPTPYAPKGLVLRTDWRGDNQYIAAPAVTNSGSDTICAGGTLTLSVPDNFLHYQWLWTNNLNKVAWVPDSDKPEITVDSGGYYRCVMWDDYSYVASNNYRVIVAIPPDSALTASGMLQFCYPQETLKLQIKPNPGNTYIWTLNGSVIPGASSYQWSPVVSGTYALNVTNQCGSYQLPPVNVNVSAAPAFDIGPDTVSLDYWFGSDTVCTLHTFSVDTLNFTVYTWYHDGVAVGNSPLLKAGKAGSYYLIAQNGCGIGYSDTVQLIYDTLYSALSYNSYYSLTGCNNKGLQLSTNNPSASIYYWYRNGTGVSNTPTNSFSPGWATTGLDSGYYYCVFYASCGNVTYRHQTDSIWYRESVPFSQNISISGTTCSGTPVTLTATQTGVTYQWYRDTILIPGATSQSLVATQTDSYYCAFTASCGQYNSNNTHVFLGPPPVAVITTPTNTLCGTANDTSTVRLRVDQNASVGIANYQWRRNGVPIANAIFDRLDTKLPGLYDCLFYNTCDTTISNVIPLAVQMTDVSVSGLPSNRICSNSFVNLTALPGYAGYQWYRNISYMNDSLIPGATSNVFACNAPGTYFVKISNFGCQVKSNFIYTYSQPPTIPNLILAETSTTFCGTDSVKLNARTRSDLSYQWFYNGVSVPGAITSSLYASAAGNYTVNLTDSVGCVSASDTVDINNTALGTVPVYPQGVSGLCVGDSVTLSSPGFANYQWFQNGVAVPGATTPSYTADTSGVYTLQVATPSGCNGSGTVFLSFVTAATELTRTIGPSSCGNPNGSFQLTFDKSVDVTFTGPSPIGPISGAYAYCSNLLPGWYYYSAENAGGGCVIVDSLEVPIVNNLNVSIHCSQPVSCQGQFTSMNVNGPYNASYSYLWSTGQTTINIPNPPSGVYTVTVTDTLTGCTGTDTILITVNPLPSVNIVPAGPLFLCPGSSIALDAGPGYSQYLWSNGLTSQSVPVYTQGNCIVTVTDVNGCRNKDTVVVMPAVSPTPVITVNGPTTVCPGTAVVLDAGAGYANYLWSNLETTQSVSVQQPGNYSVIVQDSVTGCNGYDNIVISNYPSPSITFSPSGVIVGCLGDTFSLNATPGYQSYLWNTGETTSFIQVSSSGNYILTVTEAINQCTESDTSVVVMNPLPVANLAASGPTSFCIGDSVELTVSGNGSTFEWYKGNTLLSGLNGSTITVKSRGKYTCVVSDGISCSTTSNIITVTTPCQPPQDPIDKLAVSDTYQPFLVYPNPGNGQYKVIIPGDMVPENLMVIDLSGRIVQTISIPGATADDLLQLDISFCSAGLYYVQLEGAGNHTRRTRIVKL